MSAPPAERTKVDKVLVLESASAQDAAWAHIVEQVPSVEFTQVSSLDDCRAVASSGAFDVVVLNYDLNNLAHTTILQELRLRDSEPGILVVSGDTDPRHVTHAYDAGCDRCIVRVGAWRDELAPALRHMLRLRRLKEENLMIRAKLTEANSLLEEKNRRLDDFSMTIAHDIRGPLGGMCMKLEYVLETKGADLDNRSQQLLSRALDSGKRLMNMVQAMYEYAKLGTKATKMAIVSLGTLVHEVVHDMHFDDSLDIQIGIGELPSVWGNSDLLRRVFINLIGNAVKYNDKKQILINVSAGKEVQRGLARFVEIIVSDNGPGITPDDTRRLFDMFARGAQSHHSSEGLGVGLAVVQRIAELHYGEVSVNSRPGDGAAFTLLLPLEKVDFVL